MVKEYFPEICHGKVTRYELDGFSFLNFVLEDSMDGGVSLTLSVDDAGRSYGNAMLESVH